MRERVVARNEDQVRARRLPVRRRSLVVSLLSSGLFAAGLVCLYLVMRRLVLESGGACASGGPYEIRTGQECQDGIFAFAYGGIGVMVAGFLVLLRAAWTYGGSPVVTSATGVGCAGFFGGLGLSFLAVRSDLPTSSTEGGDYTFVGILFLVFGAAGLVVTAGPPIFAMLSKRLDVVTPSGRAWLAWLGAVAAGAALGIVVTALIAG